MSGKPRLWTGDFILLLCMNLLAYISCQALNNGTPIYVVGQGGATALSGALILEFSLSAAVARIVSGRWIDTGTRKRVMLVGAALLLAGTVPAIVLPGIEPQFALRILQGLGFGCAGTAAATAAADVLPKERLGEGIGYFGLGQSLGMAIGPTLAVVLTSLVFAESLFVGVACCALALLLLACACTYESNFARLPETSAYRVRRMGACGLNEGHACGTQDEVSAIQPCGDEPDSDNAHDSEGLHDAQSSEDRPVNGLGIVTLVKSLFVKSALPGAIPMVIACLGYSIIVNFTSLYGVQRGIENPGLFFVFAAVTMTAVRLGGGSLIDRVRPIRLYAAPLACGVIALVLLANVSSTWMFWVAGASFGLSMGLAFPLLNSVCVKNTVPERWGAASGLFGLMNDIGIGVGALVWSAAADVIGFVPVMYGGCIMLALSYVAALFLFPKEA